MVDELAFQKNHFHLHKGVYKLVEGLVSHRKFLIQLLYRLLEQELSPGTGEDHF